MMEGKTPKWEELDRGVRILRLYETELNPRWPRVLVLQLTAEKFKEFDHNILAFDEKYHLLPNKPIRWASSCVKPPGVKGVADAPDSASWTVVMLKGPSCKMVCAASPEESS